MILGHSWRWCAVAAALSVWGLPAAPVFAQWAAAGRDDLPVTRLQGVGLAAEGAPQLPAAPTGDLSTLPVTQLADRAAADLDGPRRIALSLARPMPLKDMLLLLVSGTPFSLVTDEAVDGTFTGDLKNLTMRQALEAVLFARGLDYEVDGSLIRVSAHKPETRLFPVNFIDERRVWRRSAGDGRDAAVTASGGLDWLDELRDGVRALLSETGKVHVDQSAGLVQVTDFTERLERVGVYVEAVQARSLRQVRIEARVFEVTLTDAAALGIDWKAAGARARNTGDSSGATGLTVPDAGAFMKALAEQGTIAMIAAPQIVAMNNEPALMRVGTQTAYFETGSAGRNGRSPATATSPAVLEGVTLMVTPQLAGDGAVQLSVSPSYAERTGDGKPHGSSFSMRISEADTVLRVTDGDTVVIAGFLRDRTRTRPGVGLASYFGAETHETVRAELVILLTPTVLPAGGGATARR